MATGFPQEDRLVSDGMTWGAVLVGREASGNDVKEVTQKKHI